MLFRSEQSETARLEALRQRLETLAKKRCMTDQLAYVQDKRMELLHAQQRLGDLAAGQLARKKQGFSALAASLDAMSPLKVLGRGYAMVQKEDGALVRSWQDAPSGTPVTVVLGEGGLSCTVDRAFADSGNKRRRTSHERTEEKDL